LSELATHAYESARKSVQQFINAPDPTGVVFVRGTTEAINLVAQAYGKAHVGPMDEIVISAMEHHSNIVPWQRLCQENKAILRIIPITERGEIVLSEYERLLNDHTKMVSIAHVSNVLGTINPVHEMVRLAHLHGIPVLIDGAQAVGHLDVDVGTLECDFYAFSGHKMLGPTGIGVLYVSSSRLEQLEPYQSGGFMIHSVTFEKTEYTAPPYRFEAGTPDVAGAVGLDAAIQYINRIGIERIAAREQELLEYGTNLLSCVPGVRLIGEARQKAAIISFVMDGVHPHDLAAYLARLGIAIRAGHHCCQPLMARLRIPGTGRASMAVYNTHRELAFLAAALEEVSKSLI
jgi:cysteine desulfurase/selenocysteine lyase